VENLRRRYKGIPNERLSFDMLNEPPQIAEETYARVVRATV
jgi:endoglucanase